MRPGFGARSLARAHHALRTFAQHVGATVEEATTNIDGAEFVLTWGLETRRLRLARGAAPAEEERAIRAFVRGFPAAWHCDVEVRPVIL